ncbi:MAG: DUF308 domain-containing protein [Spirochaetales bacterium]|nr:DUF308 domain-containing protein [Spirochaetales bacterium]
MNILYRHLFRSNLASGMLVTIMGILFLFLPGISFIAIIFAFAFYLILASIIQIIVMYQYSRKGKMIWLPVVKGFAGFALGIVTLLIPRITSIVFLYLIAIWFLYTGVMEIMIFIQYRKEIRYSVTMIAVGIISVLFAVALMLFPGTGVYAVAWIIGVASFVWGGMYFFQAYDFYKLSG